MTKVNNIALTVVQTRRPSQGDWTGSLCPLRRFQLLSGGASLRGKRDSTKHWTTVSAILQKLGPLLLLLLLLLLTLTRVSGGYKALNLIPLKENDSELREKE